MREMHDQRTTVEIVRDIAQESATLVRKEVELARHEITDAIMTRVRMTAGLVVAGVFGFLALTFAALTVRDALAQTLDAWAASLITAAGLLMIALIAFAIGRAAVAGRPSLMPEETKRTVKEDLRWAKEQLTR